MGPLDSPEEAEGPSFETLVFQDLLAVNAGLGLGYDLFYWRTSHDVEVDFVLYGPKGMIAVEVKRTSRPKPEHFKGLKAFVEDYPKTKAFFVYGGSRRMREGEIDIIPVQEFLQHRLDERLLEQPFEGEKIFTLERRGRLRALDLPRMKLSPLLDQQIHLDPVARPEEAHRRDVAPASEMFQVFEKDGRLEEGAQKGALKQAGGVVEPHQVARQRRGDLF